MRLVDVIGKVRPDEVRGIVDFFVNEYTKEIGDSDVMRQFDLCVNHSGAKIDKIDRRYMRVARSKVYVDGKPSVFEILNNHELCSKVMEWTPDDSFSIGFIRSHSRRELIVHGTIKTCNAYRYFPSRMKLNIARDAMRHILPKDVSRPLVIDPCAGWGDRAISAASLGCDYIATDTNPESVRGIMAMSMDGVKHGIIRCGEMNVFEGRCQDELCRHVQPNTADAAFTSPPYGDLEIYPGSGSASVMPAQSLSFFYDFLVPMCKRVNDALKIGAKFSCNVPFEMATRTIKAMQMSGYRDIYVYDIEHARRLKEGHGKGEAVVVGTKGGE